MLFFSSPRFLSFLSFFLSFSVLLSESRSHISRSGRDRGPIKDSLSFITLVLAAAKGVFLLGFFATSVAGQKR